MEEVTFEIEGSIDTIKNVFQDEEIRFEELVDAAERFKNLKLNLEKLNVS